MTTTAPATADPAVADRTLAPAADVDELVSLGSPDA